MRSNKSINEEIRVKNWLVSKSDELLENDESVEFVAFLKNTIKNDLRASNCGFTFDHKFEIQPKGIFTTKDKKGNLNLGIFEFSSTAIGLKDVGILHTYARMVEPKYAFLLCEKSFSKELTYLLTDPRIAPRLLEYTTGKQLRLLDYC